MGELLDKLRERERELQSYVRFVVLIDQEHAQLSLPDKKKRRTRPVDEQIVKILKANFFLLLYNLVEASMRDGLRVFYAAIVADGCTVRALSDELRVLWIDAALGRVTPQTASLNSYRDVTRRLVQETVLDVGALLHVNDLRFGGSLDAARIRKTCADHGIPHRTRPEARGGEKLRLVKDRRNDLAHGGLSFVECGRDYSSAQLVDIKREALMYVRGILRNIERHASKRAFRSRTGRSGAVV